MTKSSSFQRTLKAALAIVIFLLPFAAKATVTSRCAPDFARLHVSHERFQASFQALKRDLPQVKDPVQFVQEFSERRRQWNLEFPQGHPRRNNFPAPELEAGVKEVRTHLAQIKRPPENRVAAEKLIQELLQAETSGFPYRDTFRSIESATFLIQLKFRSPNEKAEAIALSMRFANLLPTELQQSVQASARKYRVLNTVPETDLRSQEQADKFDANAANYFKDLKSRLESFLKTTDGQNFRRSLEERRSQLDQTKAVGSSATRQLNRDKREIEAFLQIFVNEGGIQRFVTRPTITQNPTHPLGVPKIDESLFENEILIPTSRALHVEGLAESFMIGITPVQIISRPRRADELWMDSYLFANHDGFHRFMATQESLVNREILGLPLAERLQVLTEIDRLPEEKRSIARTALYLTVHENGSNSALPMNTPGAATFTRDEFKRLAGRDLSISEVAWVRNWYQQAIQRRVDHFRRSSPP